MIFSNSRYEFGLVGQVTDGHATEPTTYVLRDFRNVSTPSEYFLYRITEADRLDTIASNFLGDPNAWYKIMDINPDFLDPFNIPMGSVIRIPSVNVY
jgi:hypothetical protein